MKKLQRLFVIYWCNFLSIKNRQQPQYQLLFYKEAGADTHRLFLFTKLYV